MAVAIATTLPAYAPSHAQTPAAVLSGSGVVTGPVTPPVSGPVAKVVVQRYQVSGNTLLPAAQIDAVLGAYLGERSLDELKTAALAVQALYRDAGYGAVVAFVPEQTSPGGAGGSVVSITVVEGQVARITVTGNSAFSESNIRASLPSLVEGVTPRVREIDAQIQLANENPAKELEVLLQPGAAPGQVDARIQVSEQPISRFTIGADNTGNKKPGRWRTNFGYQNANLWGGLAGERWGADHVLALQLQLAPEALGDVTVASANYRIPFYAAGMALDAYAAYSDVDGGSTPTAAGALQFAGKGRIAGVRLSKYLPRLGEVDQRVVLGLDHRDYINNCTIAGLPAGACGQAGESVSVQPLALEYIAQRGGKTPWGASIGLQHNLQLGGGHASDAHFAAVRPGSTPNYTLLRLGLFAGVSLPEQWQLQTKLIGQFTDDALVPGEQFGIGGASSVRGYDEREITGDRGASASVEVFSPDFGKSLGLVSGTLRALGFVDAGWVHNRLGTPCRLTQADCNLAGVGLGLRYGSGPLQAKLDVAYALKSGNRTERHDARAHFSVSYRF